MKKCVIFDLDGTLLYTLEDLADSMNSVLENRGFPVHPLEKYNRLVGNGVAQLVLDSLPRGVVDESGAILKEYKYTYNKRWNNKTRPYDGITKLLNSLIDKGLKVAVFSNKPQGAMELCLNEFFGDINFSLVRGARENFPLKPSPDGVDEILKELNCSKSETVFVGDSSVDMKTAKNAKLTAIGVLWGYRSRDEILANGADFLAETADDILKIIERD
jgi:phosphoglycolate phosphatase